MKYRLAYYSPYMRQLKSERRKEVFKNDKEKISA
jgi:hypothetical protein